MTKRVSLLQRLLVTGGFLLGIFPTLPAQIVGAIEADVPFPFVVADTTLAPGSYVIEPRGGDDPALEIRRADGEDSALALITRSVGASLPVKTELLFRQYDGQRFLSLVVVEGNHEKAEVEPSRAEKQLKREGSPSRIQIVPARHRNNARDPS